MPVPPGMANVTELNDSTFDEVVRSADRPVLVDFTAAWCGPCQTIAPILEDIATEQADRLQVVKIDVDANPQTTLRYEVMSMPTLILFKDGEPQRRLIGARGKHNLLEHLADVI
jgi:thioredoxin 1